MATTPVQQLDSNAEEWVEFLELEDKIGRIAETLQQARAERDRALAELKPLQAAHEKLQRVHTQSEHELIALRKERGEVRQRIARLSQKLETADR
ncbi:MAG: hypothetical protein ACRD1Y_12385 [Terriglobales bacterium]